MTEVIFEIKSVRKLYVTTCTRTQNNPRGHALLGFNGFIGFNGFNRMGFNPLNPINPLNPRSASPLG